MKGHELKHTFMWKHTQMLINIFVVILISFSCVGTIEDKNTQTTKSAGAKIAPVAFDGIQDAIPVGHNKVDVLFYPATGGSGDYTYLISYDGLATPISVPALTMSTDYRGLYKYTVDGLSINTTYSFQVQIIDEQSGGTSFTETAVAATTFSNLTCSFSGIGSVSPLSGANGLNAINVTWAEGEQVGSDIFAEEPDPYQYVVTVIDSDLLTPGDMNNNAYADPERRVFFFGKDDRNVNIYGLNSGKTYHVQVRCEHEGYKDNSGDPDYKREENTNYKTITTLSAGAAGIEWETNLVNLSLGPGASGLNTLKMDWPGAEGAFDHYRIYTTRTESGDPALNTAMSIGSVCQNSCYSSASSCGGGGCLTRADCYADSGHWVNCKQVDLNQVTTFIVGLEEKKFHESKVMVCQDINCSIYVESPVLTQKTEPGLAVYDGVINIDPPQSFDSLGTVWLNVLSPQLETGIIDGIIVEFTGQLPTDTPVVLNGAPDFINTSSLTVGTFDFQTATQIPVQGIDPYSGLPYCFKSYGYTLDGGGAIVPKPISEQQDPVCIYPSPTYITPPNNLQYLGASNCTPLIEAVSVGWGIPFEGIFDKFEVFYKDDSVGGAFNFTDAVAEANSGSMTNYNRVLVNGDQNSFVIQGLNPLRTYTFGVLSYFAGLDGVKYRSEFNSGMRTCTPLP